MNPLVSVIIPTYNRAELFQKALASAVDQSYEALEILVVDDASPDHTVTVARSVDDDRIRIIQNETNLGPNKNWRKGIACSRGDLFCFLADDDVLSRTFVERLVEPFRSHDGLALAFSDHRVIDEDGRHLPKTSKSIYHGYGRSSLAEGVVPNFIEAALIKDSIYIGAAMFSTEVIRPEHLHPEARSAMGGWLFYQCVRERGHAYYVDEPLMDCRWIQGSVSRSRRWQPALDRGTVFRFEKMLNDPILEPHRDALLRKYEGFLLNRAPGLLHGGSRAYAKEFAQRALALRWSWMGALVLCLASLGPVGTGLVRLAKQIQVAVLRHEEKPWHEEE